jgi:hypothetical protein
MKTSIKTTIKIIPLSLVLFLHGCSWFDKEKECEILSYADLIIPQIIDIYNQNNQRVINYYGQPMRGENAIYFNERTGEYFNSSYPPILGIQPGDFIQMGVRVFNKVLQEECDNKKGGQIKTGATAGQTQTAVNFNATSLNGAQTAFNVPPLQTPAIPVAEGESNSNSQFAATRFQIPGPGYYSVSYQSNNNRSITEHDYSNNSYNNQNSNAYQRSANFDFFVEEKSNKQNNILIKNIDNKVLENFVNKGGYADFLLKKSQNKNCVVKFDPIKNSTN